MKAGKQNGSILVLFYSVTILILASTAAGTTVVGVYIREVQVSERASPAGNACVSFIQFVLVFEWIEIFIIKIIFIVEFDNVGNRRRSEEHTSELQSR